MLQMKTLFCPNPPPLPLLFSSLRRIRELRAADNQGGTHIFRKELLGRRDGKRTDLVGLLTTLV